MKEKPKQLFKNAISMDSKYENNFLWQVRHSLVGLLTVVF